MALKFEFIQNKLQITPAIMLFKEFIDILKWDKTVTKVKANKLFSFVFYMSDLTEENPCSLKNPKDIETEAKFLAFHNKYYQFSKKEYELVSEAVYRYVRCNTTAEERIIEAFDQASEKLLDKLNSTSPKVVKNEKDGIKTYATNVPIITAGLTQLDDIKKRKLAIIASIKKQAIHNRVRGKIILSPLSKGIISLPDTDEESIRIRNIQETTADKE